MKNYIIKSLFKTGIYPGLFVAAFWAIYFIDKTFHLHLIQLGTSPRTFKGITGVLFSPFLHSDFDHLLSNTLPVLILGMLTFYFYKPIAWPVFLWIYFISGIWLWVGGRNNESGDMYHIGASGLIYGAALFLFFSGVFRKHKQLMVISALVLFIYGSMMWGVFPLKQEISWEAHLFGALSGLMVAYNYRKEGPQAKEYEWEEEEENTDELGEFNNDSDNLNQNSDSSTTTFTYHFIPKQSETDNNENNTSNPST